MVLQHLALLGSMALILVVSAVQVLISPRWVASHLVQPFEVRLVLNPIYDPMHRLFKCYIDLPYLCFCLLNPQTPPEVWSKNRPAEDGLTSVLYL